MTFGANTNLGELITLLTASNEKLDTIITLLGGAPPTPEHTLDDLYQVLSDIHLDTQSMDLKLLAIRNYIKDPSEPAIDDDYSSLLWNVYRLRRAVSPDILPSPGSLTPIQLNVDSIFNQIFDNFPLFLTAIGDIRNYVFYGMTNSGLDVTEPNQLYTGYIEVIRNSILALKGSVGVPANALNIGPVGSRDVIQLLSVLGELTQTNIGQGIEPREQCPDAYISVSMALVPIVFDAWPSTVWAVWPTPTPTDISFGSVFGIGVDNTELVNANGNWNNYYLYVASDAGNCGLYIGGDIDASFTRYPTNVWLDLNGYTNNLSVFVGGDNSLRCYLCNAWVPPSTGGGPWGDGGSSSGGWFGECLVAASEIMTVTYPPGTTPGSHTRYYTPLSGSPLVLSSYMDIGGTIYSNSVSDGVTTSNMKDTRVRLTSGPLARVVMIKPDSGLEVHIVNTSDPIYVVPFDTIYFNVDNWTTNDISPGTAYTVELCPPGSY